MSWVFGGTKRTPKDKLMSDDFGSWTEPVVDVIRYYYIYCGKCGSLHVKSLVPQRNKKASETSKAFVISLPVFLVICAVTCIYGLAYSYRTPRLNQSLQFTWGIPLCLLVLFLIYVVIAWVIKSTQNDISESDLERQYREYNKQYGNHYDGIHGTAYECLDCHQIFIVDIDDGTDNPKRKTKEYLKSHGALTVTVTVYDMPDD